MSKTGLGIDDGHETMETSLEPYPMTSNRNTLGWLVLLWLQNMTEGFLPMAWNMCRSEDQFGPYYIRPPPLGDPSSETTRHQRHAEEENGLIAEQRMSCSF